MARQTEEQRRRLMHGAPQVPAALSGAEALRQERIATNIQRRQSQQMLAPQFGQLTRDIARFRANNPSGPLSPELSQRRLDLHTMRAQGLTPNQFQSQSIELDQQRAGVDLTRAQAEQARDEGLAAVLRGRGAEAQGIGAMIAPQFQFAGQARQAQAQERLGELGLQGQSRLAEAQEFAAQQGTQQALIATAPQMRAMEMMQSNPNVLAPGFSRANAPMIVPPGAGIFSPQTGQVLPGVPDPLAPLTPSQEVQQQVQSQQIAQQADVQNAIRRIRAALGTDGDIRQAIESMIADRQNRRLRVPLPLGGMASLPMGSRQRLDIISEIAEELQISPEILQLIIAGDDAQQ